MAFVIAVAGKGGVGKSTLAALLVRVLAEKSKSVVLAVDADPNSNLGDKLGMKVERTIGDIREDLLKQTDEAASSGGKHDLIRYQVQLAMSEGQGFDLLTMGRPEGRGCYCYINNVLRTFLDEIMDDYPYVVIDNEAGMEHLSRRTCRKMNVLLVVSDATKVGIETGTRLLNLAKSMGIEIGTSVLAVNRFQDAIERDIKSLMDKAPFDKVACIPYDAEVDKLSSAGKSIFSVGQSSNAYLSIKLLVGVMSRTGSL